LSLANQFQNTNQQKQTLGASWMATEKILEQVLNNQGSVVVNRKT
jgi:hypothetical protein